MSKKFLYEYERPTREHWAILGFSWAGWVFDFYNLILYTFLLIEIGKEFHVTDVELGIVHAASLAATAIGGILFGYLSDIYGRKPVLQWTILIYSIGTALCAVATDIWQLLILRFVAGLGIGGEWAVGQTLVGETWPPKMRARGAALMQSGVPVGVAVASLVGGFVSPVIGWRMTFFLSSLPAFMVVFIRKGMPESDLWLHFREMLHRGELPDEWAERLGRNPLIRIFDKEIIGSTAKGLLLATFGMYAYWFIFSWLPKCLSEEMGIGLAGSGLWVFISQMGALIGYLSFGPIADRIGRRPAFTIFSLTQAVSIFILMHMISVFAKNPIYALIPLFFMGLGTGFFSGYGPLYTEIFPTHVRTTAAGFCFNVARGLSAVAPIVVALVAVQWGLSGAISIAAMFNVMLALFVWAFPETRGKVLKAVEKP